MGTGLGQKTRGVVFALLAAVVLHAQTLPSPNVVPPSVVYKVDPEYTAEARDAKLEGAVQLAAVIGTDGVAYQIRVTRSLGKGLDEKAILALEKWRFKPGTRDKEPIPMKVTIEMNFHLLLDR